MARYHAAVESRRSAAETFGYLATFSNAVQRDPGVLAGEQLDPGPVRVGSRFRLAVPFLGIRMSLTYVAGRAAAGLTRALSARPPHRSTARPGTPAPSIGTAGRPGDTS